VRAIPPSETETRAAVRAAVADSARAALARAEAHEAPFPHVHLRSVFPPALYARLLAEPPSADLYRPDDLRKHVDESGRSTRDVFGLDAASLARLDGPRRALWTGVAEALSSPEVRDAVFRALGAPARVVYPRPGITRDHPGYELLPHPDTRAKVVTVQLYLAPPEARPDLGTTLYRRRIWKLESLRSPRRMFEAVEEVPYEPNSGYAFVVGRRTWHGRERLPPGCGVRCSLLLFYYDDPSRGW
jgi:hypothetical protein